MFFSEQLQKTVKEKHEEVVIKASHRREASPRLSCRLHVAWRKRRFRATRGLRGLCSRMPAVIAGKPALTLPSQSAHNKEHKISCPTLHHRAAVFRRTCAAGAQLRPALPLYRVAAHLSRAVPPAKEQTTNTPPKRVKGHRAVAAPQWGVAVGKATSDVRGSPLRRRPPVPLTRPATSASRCT